MIVGDGNSVRLLGGLIEAIGEAIERNQLLRRVGLWICEFVGVPVFGLRGCPGLLHVQ